MRVDSLQRRKRTESSVGVWRENLSMSKAIILKLGKNNDEMRKNILELELFSFHITRYD